MFDSSTGGHYCDYPAVPTTDTIVTGAPSPLAPPVPRWQAVLPYALIGAALLGGVYVIRKMAK
jgi:hypothetical protein